MADTTTRQNGTLSDGGSSTRADSDAGGAAAGDWDAPLLLERVLESTGTGYAVMGSDGTVHHISPSLARIIGFDHTQCTRGEEVMANLYPDEAERARATAMFQEDAGRPEGPARLFRVTNRATGARPWVRMQIVRHGDGIMVLAMREVTERQQDRLALEESEERYRGLVEQAADSIFLVDEDQRFVDANPAALESLGYSLEELRGLCIEDVLADSEREIPVSLPDWQEARTVRRKRTVLRKDGTEVRFEISARPLPSGMTVSIGRDITESERSAEQLRQRHEQLAAAHAELEQLQLDRERFLAMVSHELRTPLVTGMGYVDLVLEGRGGELPESVTSRLKVGQRNLKRLARQIDSLLDYQSFAGQIRRSELRKRATDVQVIGEESRSGFIVRSAIDPERVVLDIPGDVPAVMSDADLLRMVLANLLDNAGRHAGQTATIRLAARTLEGGKGVRVEVADDGAGMDPELRDRAFQPFVKRGDLVDGSGLGLAIVKAMLEPIGTDLMLESVAGEGTRISFVLPVAAAPTAGRP